MTRAEEGTASHLREVSIAIIGPGTMGEIHATAINEVGGRIGAVAGPDPEQSAAFATKHGIDHAGEFDAVIRRDDIHAVVLASPSPVHTDQAVAALRAGKHVLCEIPVGLSLAEAEKVVRESDAAGRHVMVAHTRRFSAPEMAVRAKIDRGELRVRSLIIRHHMFRQRDIGWTGQRRDWTDSVLWHHGAHVVDAALWFLDSSDVDVRGACGPKWSENGQPMDVAAVLVSAAGDLAGLSLSYHSRVGLRDYVIVAEDETLEIREGRLYGSDGVIVDSSGPDETHRNAVAKQDAEFLAALLDGRPPAFVARDALPTMRVLDRLEQSARAVGT